MKANNTEKNARHCATEILAEAIDRKRGLEAALESHEAMKQLDARDRHFVHLMVLTTMRRLGQIDALMARCMQRALLPRWNLVRHAMRLGVAQLYWIGTPPHAAVNETVKIVGMMGLPTHKALANAVLNRLAREKLAMLEGSDEARQNTPDWLWQSWVSHYGESGARQIALAHLQEPPLDITPMDQAADWAAQLNGRLLPSSSVRLAQAGRIESLPGYDQGRWWIQDAAAALPVRLLGDVRGLQVADLCAAPGGKTAQLAAAGGRVTAVDRAPRRMKLLWQNMQRLGLQVALVEADAGVWKPGETFDAVLLDAPCSATGTLRRHPDIGWLKTPQDVAQLQEAQRRLLTNAAHMLKPGGKLVYSVCSLQPQEGEAQRDWAQVHLPDLRFEPVSPDEIAGQKDWLTARGELRTLPSHLAAEGGMDGFYAARFVKL